MEYRLRQPTPELELQLLYREGTRGSRQQVEETTLELAEGSRCDEVLIEEEHRLTLGQERRGESYTQDGAQGAAVVIAHPLPLP